MSISSGLLIFFDEQHRGDLIQERMNGTYDSFSDALSVPDWDIRQLSVALLSFSDSTIDYIALVKKGKRVITSKFKAEFSNLVDLGSIPVASIESMLKAHIRHYFIRSSRGVGGAVPNKTWLAVIKAIKEIRPNAVHDIDRLLSLRRYAGIHLYGEAAEILLQEREAIGAALDIFSGSNQLREHVLGAWAPSDNLVSGIDENAFHARLAMPEPGKSSFLHGIPRRYLTEESALQHDLFSWDGLTPTHEAGTSVFEQGDRRLEVIYANRNPLEKTLGVDLIYYNQAYELFVLVQYKLMREEGQKIVYRPDSQLRDEINRMDLFYKRFHHPKELQSHKEFRLNPDGFMLKLVPNKGLRPASGELIKGMYVKREYMKFLIGSNGPKGAQGGTSISFDNAPRYFTNTEFTRAIHRGWVGTSGVHSDMLIDLVSQYYETGRAVLLAYESNG